MCQWQSKLDPSHVCKVPPEPGSEFCIFHKPGEKDLEAFKERLKQQIKGEGPSDARNSPYDFAGYIFPGDVVLGSSNLSEKTFAINSISTETVVFNECQVAGDLKITLKELETTTLLFLHAKVSGNYRCPGLVCRSLSLQNAKIGKIIDMRGCQIKGEVDFQETVIGGDILLSEAQIGGAALFNSSQVEGDVALSRTEIKGSIAFREARVVGRMSFDETAMKGPTDFGWCKAGSIWLGNDRPSLIGKRRLGIASLVDKRTGYSFWVFARLLLEDECNWDRADCARYFERIWKWKAGRKSLSEGPLWRRFTFPLSYVADFFFLRAATAYGASLYRLFVSWAVVIGIFASIHFLNGSTLDLSSSGIAGSQTSFWRALYFSIVTFTTLGYGDIRPAPGLGSALCAAEAILGATLIALTVLVIGRKFMR